MKLFIDTANIEEIQKANDLGVICGVTTNPSLIAKEGRDFKEVIKEITEIVDGPISGEVKATTTQAEDMVIEAREIAKIHKNMVVKIPMCEEGLKAVKILSQEGISTNVTLVFSATQALLAAIAASGIDLVADIMQIFNQYGFETEVICASIRHPIHVIECARLGADIATVPYQIIMQMIQHPLTDIGVEKFIKDYQKVFG